MSGLSEILKDVATLNPYSHRPQTAGVKWSLPLGMRQWSLVHLGLVFIYPTLLGFVTCMNSVGVWVCSFSHGAPGSQEEGTIWKSTLAPPSAIRSMNVPFLYLETGHSASGDDGLMAFPYNYSFVIISPWKKVLTQTEITFSSLKSSHPLVGNILRGHLFGLFYLSRTLFLLHSHRLGPTKGCKFNIYTVLIIKHQGPWHCLIL